MKYVHGYDGREAARLADQANSLATLLHHDTVYPPGAKVLEAGCGVGAQTVILARNSPEASITSIDLQESSLAQAHAAIAQAGAQNVTLQRADIFELPFADAAFDHVFICFVLEHIEQPLDALAALIRVLKVGGTMTVIEGDHGSTIFHPESSYARRAVDCLVALQERAGGNGLIGRSLYPLLTRAGLDEVQASARIVYADASKPELVDSFTRRTFTAMVEGVRADAIAAGLMPAAEFDRGINDLYRAAGPDGTFGYTFFKAVGIKGSECQ